ncbi:MAG TPA: hypothetical protein PK033_03585 [Acetivibrio sp.]|jgi:hypothetical protein|nr:hypothetical protein [Clostridium sp.]HQA56941.1 hypothetical protein [Acetivibrio sp.]
MRDSNLQRRTELALLMLNNLKEVYFELKKLSSSIESNSDEFYQKLFHSSKSEIEKDLEGYKANIERIRELNLNATEIINRWYDFIKDSNEIKKATFPIKLHFQKKKVKDSLTKINKEISDLSIENRFIREKIVNWEQELSVKALQEIKNGNEFDKYEELIRKKDYLVSELKYLLATIPGMNNLEFEMENIDEVIEKLIKIAAA